MSLAAGRLRSRIDIRRVAEVDDGRGGSDLTVTPIATGVRAEVKALTGSEAVLEKVLQDVRVYRITIRWRGDVSAKDQIRYGTEELNVRSAVDPDERREQLVIIADTRSTLG
ncbi:phage head closure protein [Sphingomonas adhaesiva]|uniref:phage head closure protein n=1 Tax=Sphingomonas adhaesiva TaxID=28212 RepID=UPI002FF8B8B7